MREFLDHILLQFEFFFILNDLKHIFEEMWTCERNGFWCAIFRACFIYSTKYYYLIQIQLNIIVQHKEQNLDFLFPNNLI